MTVNLLPCVQELREATAASAKNDEREQIYLFMFDGIFSRKTFVPGLQSQTASS